MKACWSDFRICALLARGRHWRDCDMAKELSVERAEYWLPIITKLHIPQQALFLHLQGQLHYYKDEDGKGWKDLISALLAKRALVLIALDHAVRHKQPVKW